MRYFKFFLLFFPFSIFSQNSQNFKTFKLTNGLTVVLDKDPLQNEVFGVIGVNAGSRNEEEDATGVAHYLEHMLFKGTKELGTANWEAEKQHYQNIIKLYDELEKAKSDDKAKEIYKKINEESQKQSKYVITNEFTKLIQQMGGTGLNATTSFDVTRYFNTFPPNQLERWLDLYAHRFKNPVFRLFQTELETVYEEKNRAEDNPLNGFINALNKSIYGEHPYARPIIGKTSHLKKPSMSKMIAFYNKWYVPSNMVLVLSGNFDIVKAERLINEKFGKLKAKPMPTRKKYSLKKIKGQEKVKVKLTPFLRAVKVYNGPKDRFSKEGIALSVASELLSNSARIGLLDRLSLEGSAMFINVSFNSLKEGTNLLIDYAPVFDSNQRRQLSFSSVEDLIDARIKVLYNGTYNFSVLEQIKENLIKQLSLNMESPNSRAFGLLEYFIYGKKPEDYFKTIEKIKSITKDDISSAVKKYLANDFLLFYSYKGEGKKEKVKKPEIKPIKPLEHKPSIYADKFTNIPSDKASHNFVDFSKSVKRGVLQDKVNLYYVPNKRNNVFSLQIVFHAGTLMYPKLEYAASLMNNAGIAPNLKSSELKKEFGKLGITYSFGVNENYTFVNLRGKEESLAEACKLLSKLLVLPKITEKSVNRILGNIYYSRSIESKKPNTQFAALKNFIKYGEKSDFIERLSFKEIKEIRPSEMVSEFSKAIKHEADIHYYGKKSMDDVANTLITNLAFSANRIPAELPKSKQKVAYNKNKIFIINNNNVTQSKIYIYTLSNPTSLRKEPLVDAFNQYFSGGFNGIVLKEIREYRSLAYSAASRFSTPLNKNENSYLEASIGTQTDKTNEAIELFIKLLNNIPVYESRMKNVNDYLYNSSFLDRPSDRNLSLNVFMWRLKGYKKDPRFFKVPAYKVIKMNNIIDFYKKNIKDKPYAIGIVGSLKNIDLKKLKKLGDVKVLDAKKIFSDD